MSVQRLTVVPSPTLRKVSQPAVLDKKTQILVKDLSETLLAQNSPKGVGLSAPQIGKNVNIFATLLAPDLREEVGLSDLRVFINPTVIGTSSEMTMGDDEDDPILEGCLSIPSIYGPVPRHKWIEIEYDKIVDDHFEKTQERFVDFFARVVQHEYDHLRGILFTDYSFEHDLPVYEHLRKKMVEIDKSMLKAY